MAITEDQLEEKRAELAALIASNEKAELKAAEATETAGREALAAQLDAEIERQKLVAQKYERLTALRDAREGAAPLIDAAKAERSLAQTQIKADEKSAAADAKAAQAAANEGK